MEEKVSAINDEGIYAFCRVLGAGSHVMSNELDEVENECVDIIHQAACDMTDLWETIVIRNGFGGERSDGSVVWIVEPNPMSDQEKIDKFNTIINTMLGSILYLDQ